MNMCVCEMVCVCVMVYVYTYVCVRENSPPVLATHTHTQLSKAGGQGQGAQSKDKSGKRALLQAAVTFLTKTLCSVASTEGLQASDEWTPTQQANVARVVELYTEYFGVFVGDKRSKLTTAMFLDVCNHVPALAWRMCSGFAGALATADAKRESLEGQTACGGAFNVYLMGQGFSVLESIVKHRSVLSSDASLDSLARENAFPALARAIGTLFTFLQTADKGVVKMDKQKSLFKAVHTIFLCLDRTGSIGIQEAVSAREALEACDWETVLFPMRGKLQGLYNCVESWTLPAAWNFPAASKKQQKQVCESYCIMCACANVHLHLHLCY
jgi:hypothetical protein